MTEFAQINLSTAQDLAQKNIEVFVNEADATYITYPELAKKNLKEDAYEVIKISDSACLSYLLMTHHYISSDECCYPIRDAIQPLFIPEPETNEEPH